MKAVEVDPKKPYWFIHIHRLNEEHPEALSSYHQSDFVTSLENASKESDFDYAESERIEIYEGATYLEIST